ncbi:protein kinase [Gemmatimonadota bacterium]
MGEVWLAEDTSLGRKAALKFLPTGINPSDEEQARFLREAQAASALDHNNICTIYEAGETEEGTSFIAMAYCEGETLKEKIARGPLPLDEVLDITRQIGEGLARAHREGIIHRDIKPSNVLITIDGVAKIADFGLAAIAGATKLTKTGTSMGTVAYAAPEQLRGDQVDHRADIWSLGVVFYEMITGRLPFEAEHEQGIVAQIMQEEPVPITAQRARVPMVLERLVDKALSKNSADRYQHVDDLLVDLRTSITLNGEAKDSAKATIPRLASRKWTVRASVILGLVLLVAGGISRKVGNSMNLVQDRIYIGMFTNQSGLPELDQMEALAVDAIINAIRDNSLGSPVGEQTARQIAQFVQADLISGRSTDPISALAEQSGARFVITGDIYVIADRLQFGIQVTDSQNKRDLGGPEPVSGDPTDPFSSLEELTSAVIRFLAPILDERITNPTIQLNYLPQSLEAYRAFYSGRELYIGNEQAEAINNFAQARVIDPDYLTPLVFMGLCYLNLGQYAQVDSVLSKLESLRAYLSEYEQCWLDYLRGRITGQYKLAYTAARRAAELDPGSKAVYNTGHVLLMLNRPREALSFLESIPPDKGPMRGWTSLGRRHSLAYYMLGNHRKELRAIRKARLLYPENRAVLANELRALAALGRQDQILNLLDVGFELPPGEYSDEWLINFAANHLLLHGFQDQADALFDQLLERYSTSDVPPRGSLAYVYYRMGRQEEALKLYEQLHLEYPTSVTYLGRLGCIYAMQGDRTHALVISDSLAQLTDDYSFGNYTSKRACIAAWLGDFEEAFELLKQAVEEGYRLFDSSYVAYDLTPMWEYAPFVEWMKPKG